MAEEKDKEKEKQAFKNRRVTLRRNPRPKIKVLCYKGSLDIGQNIAVSLLDVSESGVRLIVKTALDPNQQINFSLQGPIHMRPLSSTGRVVWAVPTADGNCCIGVRLDKYLRYQDILSLT
jgi:hypothetical protein